MSERPKTSAFDRDRAQEGRRPGFIGDVLHVVRRERKWWLVPLLLFLFAATGLMLAAGVAGPLAPFIYPFL